MLIRKERSYAEIYNDLDGEVVNLFRVLRERPRELARALALTPFARDEYRGAFEVPTDPLELARGTVIRSFMGFGSNAINRDVKSGFRSNSNRSGTTNSNRSGTTPAHNWVNFPANVRKLARRLGAVVIENKPAADIIETHDGPETLFYLDPPYVHSTRVLDVMHGNHGYTHEMSDPDHEALAATLAQVKGMIVLSGYHSDLYDRLYDGWQKVEREALGDGACKRTEVLWFNAAAWDALHADTHLFGGASGIIQ